MSLAQAKVRVFKRLMAIEDILTKEDLNFHASAIGLDRFTIVVLTSAPKLLAPILKRIYQSHPEVIDVELTNAGNAHGITVCLPMALEGEDAPKPDEPAEGGAV